MVNKQIIIGEDQLFLPHPPGKMTIINLGNCMFPFGILSLVDIKKQTVLFSFHKHLDPDKCIELFNKFDILIMPLPDKMRAKNIEYFKLWNKIIPKLKCKICLASIAVFPDTPRVKMQKDEIDEIKIFLKLIFDRCKTINVRGENSKNFIVSLGFPEDRIKVLGCPSMYALGPEIKLKNTEITNDSNFVIFENMVAPIYRKTLNVSDFFDNNIKQLKNWEYIITRNFEYEFLRDFNKTGIFNAETIKFGVYKKLIINNLMKTTNPVKGFEKTSFPLNFTSWIKLLENKDFCLTSRVHSGIMSILFGIPTLVVCVDTRMEEICNVFNIPHVLWSDVDGNTNMFDLIKNIDFNQINNGFQEKFWQYIDFLNENGVETIYDGGKIPEKNYYLEYLKTTQNENLVLRLK